MIGQDVSALIESVKDALRAGRFADAEERCRKVFTLDPGNPIALFIVASLAANDGRTAMAIDCLRALLVRDPLSWKPHEVLSRLLLQVGEVTEGTAAASRACELDPTAAEAHSALGACYVQDGKPAEALASLRHAIDIQPGLMPAHHHLGVALRKLGQDAEAEAEFRQAIRLDPAAPAPNVQLTKLLLDQGRDTEADACLSSAIAATASNPKMRIELASNLIAVGLPARAEKPLRETLSADPDSIEALYLLGRLLHQLGRFDEAIDSFERLLAKHPDHAQAYLDLVLARKVVSADRPMLEAIASALEKPGLPVWRARHLHYALGKAHDDLAEYEAAFPHFQAANEIASGQISGRRLSDEQRRAGIDHIRRTFTPEFFAAHTALGSESETPTLIVGMIRSGTTLVEQILSSHPDVAAGGEQSFLSQQAHLQLGAESELLARAPEVRDAYLKLLQSIGPGKRLVTDKMPLNFEALGLFHLMFPRGRIIHCRRNPADTCLSIYVTPVAKPADIGHEPDVIAAYYRQYQRLMEHWEKVLPTECMYTIDYEKLVSDREGEVRKLLAFLQAGMGRDACLHHESRGGAVRHPKHLASPPTDFRHFDRAMPALQSLAPPIRPTDQLTNWPSPCHWHYNRN